jgi:hypothetical protein
MTLVMPESKRLVFRNTSKDVPRGTALFTGMPRVGKTALAFHLARHLVGDNVFVVDWPEEEGTSTLSDCDAWYTTVTGQADLDELYQVLLTKVKPAGIVWDGLKASYDLLTKERVPSGVMPEDHGKTWNALAAALRREIIRFKMIPSVKWFIATSLVWPDTDDVTMQAGRLQVILPGQLKGTIYGLFSYNVNLSVVDGAVGQPSVRVLECAATARTVAGVRAPISKPVKGRILYDLTDAKKGVEMIANELGLTREKEAE